MSFFGVGGDRFRPSREFTPGPGDYDPAKARGFKADPKSGFLTGDRFHELEREGKQPVTEDCAQVFGYFVWPAIVVPCTDTFIDILLCQRACT